MKMSVDEGVDAAVQLGAIDHGSSDFGSLLLDCIERAAVHPERELGVVERSQEGSKADFLVNIMLYVLLVQ